MNGVLPGRTCSSMTLSTNLSLTSADLQHTCSWIQVVIYKKPLEPFLKSI